MPHICLTWKFHSSNYMTPLKGTRINDFVELYRSCRQQGREVNSSPQLKKLITRRDYFLLILLPHQSFMFVTGGCRPGSHCFRGSNLANLRWYDGDTEPSKKSHTTQAVDEGPHLKTKEFKMGIFTQMLVCC